MTLAQTKQMLNIAEENQTRLDAMETGLKALMEQQAQTVQFVAEFDAQFPPLPSNDILEDMADWNNAIH